VGVVKDTIADGVGDGRVVERFVPSFRRHLRGDDRDATRPSTGAGSAFSISGSFP
jgi:hypothetical protein